jgi:hypothetical protein
MKSLVAKLYHRPADACYTDVTFRLPDGSSVSAHRLILALASPFFEAQFYGLLASDIGGPVEIKDVESNAFRRVLEFIYNSGEIDWEATESTDYWSLMQVGGGLSCVKCSLYLFVISFLCCCLWYFTVVLVVLVVPYGILCQLSQTHGFCPLVVRCSVLKHLIFTVMMVLCYLMPRRVHSFIF